MRSQASMPYAKSYVEARFDFPILNILMGGPWFSVRIALGTTIIEHCIIKHQVLIKRHRHLLHETDSTAGFRPSFTLDRRQDLQGTIFPCNPLKL